MLHGQHRLCQCRSAFGRPLAKSLACVVDQCFLPCGGLVAKLLVCLVAMLLAGTIRQFFLLSGCLVVMLLVKNGGIKLGHLCGGEWWGIMSRRWSTVPQFGGGLKLGQCSNLVVCLAAFTVAASQDAIVWASYSANAASADKEQCCSLASTVSANVALCSAASRQQCSSARVLSAGTTAHSVDS